MSWWEHHRWQVAFLSLATGGLIATWMFWLWYYEWIALVPLLVTHGSEG